MTLTINSLVEALRADGERFRSLGRYGGNGYAAVRLLNPEPVMPGNGLVDFEVSIGGVDCDLRCPLRLGPDVREKLRAMDGWRLVEEELTVFDADGQAVRIDVLVRPAPFDKLRTARGFGAKRPSQADFEEYVWDPAWGLATAMGEGRWWLLDGDGRALNVEPFDWLGEISEGLIVAQKGALFGYIDTAGREVIPFTYTDANSFSDGRALVEQGGRSFYIDKNFVHL